MSDPISEDAAIDLEVSSQQELNRNPACDSDSQIIDLAAYQQAHQPHTGHRCGSTNRELLKNCFPSDD